MHGGAHLLPHIVRPGSEHVQNSCAEEAEVDLKGNSARGAVPRGGEAGGEGEAAGREAGGETGSGELG